MKRPTWLNTLLEQGSVAYSRVKSRDDTRLLADLTSLSLVKIDIKGRKRRIVITDSAQFAQWVEATHPVPVVPPGELRSRARNIVQRRTSKSGKTTHDVQPILLKWFPGSAPVLSNVEGDILPASSLYAQLTQEYGMVGITSDRLNRLQLPNEWWLLTVENWESFYPLSYPKPQRTILTVYLSGNVSDITLQALSQLNPAPARVLHFGDYDWAGLNIFQRLQAVFPQAGLYIPKNIEQLFQQHGDRELIENQTLPKQFDFKNPACQPVIKLIEQWNAGLEQEIVHPPSEEDFLSQ